MYFNKYYAIHKIISLGTKRSMETNISKNSGFQNHKSFSPTFSRIIECDKPQWLVFKPTFFSIIQHYKCQRTNIRGPKSLLTLFFKC